jgi:hypothetical protein
MRPVQIGLHGVEGVASRPAQFGVRLPEQCQAHRRVEDREIEPQVAYALLEQRRRQRNTPG